MAIDDIFKHDFWLVQKVGKLFSPTVFRQSKDIGCYNATLRACRKGGQWQQALSLLGVMGKATVSPDVISFNASISACKVCGQW
jgi:pentatricopeptide repeat protein